jgi:hypothetical protein
VWLLALALPLGAQGETMHHATGTFTVQVAPADASAFEQGAELSRHTLEKTFTGDLAATSRGEMLSAATEATGAMVYVAVDKVSGTLAGHAGTFLLMHQGTMRKGDAGSAALSVRVVPGSGTEALSGLAGELTITITGGVHHYDLAYTLPEH